jgi:hypothetical protein
VALLTPVAKAFLTDKGFDACVLGQQVWGGHGYIRDNGMEQLVRDARIAQIYEGTNGIQALDLLGRKVLPNNGALLQSYLGEIHTYISTLDGKVNLLPFVEALKMAANTVEQVTRQIFARVEHEPHLVSTAACDYLHLLGHLTYTYLFTRMAEASIGKTAEPFHDAKIKTGLFYIQRLLPQISSLATAALQGSGATMALGAEGF